MELTLIRQAGTQVAVTCDSQTSHAFDLLQLMPDDVEGRPPHPMDGAVKYGEAVFQALFPLAGALAALLWLWRRRRIEFTIDNLGG